MDASIIVSILGACLFIFLYFPMSLYALKRWYNVKQNPIFQKCHWDITFLFVIILIITILLSAVQCVCDNIFYDKWFGLPSIWLYHQYLSLYIVTVYIGVLMVWANYYDIKYNQLIINNEWKSLIDSAIDNKSNFFIKNKNTFGNGKYLRRYIILVYFIAIIILYLFEIFSCYVKTDIDCYHVDKNDWKQFKNNINRISMLNNIAVIIGIPAVIFGIIIKSKTPQFDDNFGIRYEIKYLTLIFIFAMLFNTPHMFVLNKYIIHNDDNHLEANYKQIKYLYHLITVYVLIDYGTGSFLLILVSTLAMIKKNKKWINLLQKAKAKTIMTSPRKSLQLNPFEEFVRKGSDVILSTFNLTKMQDEQLQVMQRAHSNSVSDEIQSKTDVTIDMEDIFKTEDGFNSFMFHISNEFSIEMVISLIEFYQFKQYIDDNYSFDDEKHDDNTLKHVLAKASAYVPVSSIIRENIFKNKVFCEKYKESFEKWQKKYAQPVLPVPSDVSISAIRDNNINSNAKDNIIKCDKDKCRLFYEIAIISHKLFCKYINIGSFAEINLRYETRNALIKYFVNDNLNEFILNITNNITDIDEGIKTFYHIFDECEYGMTTLIRYSFARFRKSALFKKLTENKS